MHGDFSRWLPRIPKNQVGILAQEGRVLLDADITAQALLGMRWQDIAARSAFGGGVAAIPADNLDAWKVVSAKLTTNSPNQAPVVHVEVMPGLTWADGLLVELEERPRSRSTSSRCRSGRRSRRRRRTSRSRARATP